MSGYLFWGSGTLYSRGTYGSFWASMPLSYTDSRHLHFSSTFVIPKFGSNKPYGFTLRCVAQLFVPFLPELSAAFLFRLCCWVISPGAVVLSTVVVRAATSGHLRLTPTQIHGTCTSTPLMLILRLTTISPTAYPSAASPILFAYVIIVSGILAQKGAENFTSESDGRKEESQ